MENLEAYNRKLLANILPVHVAEHFLSVDKPVDVSCFKEKEKKKNKKQCYKLGVLYVSRRNRRWVIF